MENKNKNILSKIKSNLLINTSVKQTLLKNTFWIMLGEGLAKLFLFFNLIIITRYLGVEQYGKLSFALAFTAIFGIIIDFGFSTYITREISQNKSSARRYIENIIAIKFISVL
jgi:O-antigen/teichoic acid export membrane protein